MIFKTQLRRKKAAGALASDLRRLGPEVAKGTACRLYASSTTVRRGGTVRAVARQTCPDQERQSAQSGSGHAGWAIKREAIWQAHAG